MLTVLEEHSYSDSDEGDETEDVAELGESVGGVDESAVVDEIRRESASALGTPPRERTHHPRATTRGPAKMIHLYRPNLATILPMATIKTV